jgi:uncharacterized membrane protein YhfC
LALYSFNWLPTEHGSVGGHSGFPAVGEAQMAAYWSTAWYDAFLPSFERLSAMIIHISMAVLVLQTFVRKQWFWVWLAVLYHAFIDFFTVPAAAGYFSKYGAEAIVGGFAVLSLIIIFALRRPEPVANAQPISRLNTNNATSTIHQP